MTAQTPVCPEIVLNQDNTPLHVAERLEDGSIKIDNIHRESRATGGEEDRIENLEKAIDAYLDATDNRLVRFHCEDASMVQRAIESGDKLLYDKEAEPTHQAVVVATVGDLQICRLYDAHNQLLLAANPAYPATALGRSDVSINGVVTTVIKSLS